MAKIRKAKKKIPYGIYCYGLDEHGLRIFCKHFSPDRKCSFLNNNEYIYDACKECDIRDRVPTRVIKKYCKVNNYSKDVYRQFCEQERK